jgi:hypothetical protein
VNNIYNDTDLIKSTLDTLLCTINGLEGCIDTKSWKIVEGARKVYWDYAVWISKQPEFNTNKDLAQLDSVFQRAGWELQGLRWTTTKRSKTIKLKCVEFIDEHNKVWNIP